MAFTSNDIEVFDVLDAVAGGRLGFTVSPSGQGGNLVPLAMPSDLADGREIYRKKGWRIIDPNNGVGGETIMRSWRPLPSNAYSCWFPASARMLNSEIIGTEEKYGHAVTKFAVASTDTTIIVTVKASALASGNDAIFEDGKLLTICGSDQDPSSDGDLVKSLVVDGAPSVSGLDVTLTLAGAVGLDLAAGALVQSYPAPVDVQTSYDSVVVTSTAGVFTAANMVLDNIGSPTLSVTITFTGATTFNAVGDFEGLVTDGELSLGSGSITVDFAPVNQFNSRPVITLPAGIFSGTYEAGDTVEFEVYEAAYYFFEKHVIPAGTSSIAGDTMPYFFQTASTA